ncbi:MAG: sigma-54 dependent transcriptional regulator [Desulfonatronovibrio sp.]
MIQLAVIDDEPAVLRALQRKAGKNIYEVHTFTDPAEALSVIERRHFHIILSDLKMPGIDGFSILERVKKISPDTEVIIMTGYGSASTAVDLVKKGAFYYLEKPFSPDQAMLVLNRAAEHLGLLDENRKLKRELLDKRLVTKIIGVSRPVRELVKFIHKVGQVDCNVLILGESGTGKELIARAIHESSTRKDKPFVSFNCGGFSEELIANELFGHEKGAFTGADRGKAGLFETAQKGTIFLDEIGETPLSMQVKLLRVLQEKKVLRVGGTTPVDLNVRIISATNRELEHEVSMARFREDLYFRLKVVTIRAPALRERKDDLPVLMEYFLKRYNNLYNKQIKGFTRKARAILNKYSFPGNVRELEHIISSAVALGEDAWIDEKDLPQDLGCLEVETISQEHLVPLWENEREYIVKVLEATNYNKVRASEILEIPRTTLWRKIKKYRIPDAVE